MLTVKTKLILSDVSGIGLFAAEPIPKGTTVWKFEPKLDLLLAKEEIETLSDSAKEQFHNYAFLDKTHGKWMLCGDDGRFFNHADNPSCDDSGADITIALRDLAPGDELTVNYKEFYGDIADHPEII